MNEEQKRKYNECIDRINAMPREELERLIAADQCPFEPEHLLGAPFGTFHCEICGEMVVAGCPHPRVSDESRSIVIKPATDTSK